MRKKYSRKKVDKFYVGDVTVWGTDGRELWEITSFKRNRLKTAKVGDTVSLKCVTEVSARKGERYPEITLRHDTFLYKAGPMRLAAESEAVKDVDYY